MNQEERERIVKDLVNHKIEEIEIGAGEVATQEDIENYEEAVRDSSDDELLQWWHSTVAEWIIPMRQWVSDEYRTEDDIPVWEDEGFSNLAEWQLEKLRNTGETDYNYNVYKYEQPY